MLNRSLLLAAMCAVVSHSLYAQEPVPVAPAATVPKRAFGYAIGTAKTRDGADTYTVSATAPSKSPLKGQQLKFSVSRTGGGSGWLYFIVGTGKSKSLAQVQAALAEALTKFPSANAGSELCKIGDIKFGGELKLVVRSDNDLEFAFDPAIRSGNPHLTRADAAAFAAILAE